MSKISRKKQVAIIIFIAFWGVIDYLAFTYQTAEWNRTLVWPDGWLHSIRSISYSGNDFDDNHGLSPEIISTVEGFPDLGAEDGILPGLKGPWKGWTDWTSYSYQIGKDESDLEAVEVMTWFSAFRVFVPPGCAGKYDVCIGNDDSIRIWKDGKQIWEKFILEARRIIPDTDIIKDVEFHEGPNVFLVALYQKTEITGFCFRIKDQSGSVVPWLGFYYWISLPSPNYGWQITLISIAIVAAFIWVDVYY